MPDFGLTRSIRQAVMRGARQAKVLRPGEEGAAAPVDELVAVRAPTSPLTEPAAATPAPAGPGATPAAQPPSMLDTLPPADPGAPTTKLEAERVTSLKFGDFDTTSRVHINYDRTTNTDEVNAILADVSARNAGRIDEARRGVITNQQVKALASDLGARESYVRAIMQRREGGILNAETILGARQVLNDSAARVYDLGKKITEGMATDLEKVQFRRQMMWHADFQTQLLGARAEAGRALNAFKIPVGVSKTEMAQLRETVEQMNGYDIEQLAKMATMTDGNVTAITRTARKYMQSKLSGTLNELFINNILSGPATHIVNTVGGALFQGMNLFETAVAARLGKFLPGEEHVQVGEATAMLQGTIGAYRDAFRIAAKTLRTGVALDDVMKFDGMHGRRTISSERMLSPEQLATPLGRLAGGLIDGVGATLRAPTERVMAPTDEFFKTLAYRAELQRQALLHVQDQLAKTPNLNLDDIEELAKEFMESAPLEIKKAADDYTRYVTFQNPLGDWGTKATLLAKSTPGGFLLAPFIRTPINLFKAGIVDRSPLGLFSKKFWRTMKAGGRERDLMLARVSMGTATSTLVASAVADGVLTGGGPQNPEQRRILEASGWRPYSIKHDGQYYSYSRLEPLAFVIGATADAVEIAAYIDGAGMEDDENFVTHAAAAIVAGIANNTTSKTFVKGVVDFSELISDPRRYMEGWARNQASALVPYSSFRSEASQLQDPYLREAWTVLDQMKIRSGIPGFSEDAPVSRDIFGEPRKHPAGLILGTMSPYPASVEKDDRVMNEIVQIMQTTQTVPVSMPGKRIEGLRLDAREYERYVSLSRRLPAANGLRFKDALRRLMGTSAYIRATDDMKSELIRDMQSRYDSMARARLEQEDPLFAARLSRHRRRKNINLGVR